MSYNYIVTAHKATAVPLSVTGNFTGPDDLNLIQAKGSNLAVSLVTSEGLKPVLDVDVFGRILAIQLFRPQGERMDLLFILTARYHVAIVGYDPIANDVLTRAYGDIKERVGKPTLGKNVAMVDPSCQLIALHLYTGQLKIVPLQFDSGSPLKAFNIRLEDLYITDIQFLHGTENPTIAYISEEPSVATGRVLKTFVISQRDKELLPGPWKPNTIEGQASLLCSVPSPYNGLIVVGADSVAYFNDTSHTVDPIVIKESVISCIEPLDHSRYLLGDFRGRLLTLFLEFSEEMESGMTNIVNMKLEVLGEISIPHTLSYLDNGVVFVGSTKGDSQLVKLSSSPLENGGYIDVLESMTNIGPILDMSVVDLDKQGRDVLVCCSGLGKDGALRIVKSGIGINEAASIDLPGIKGIWSLKCAGREDELDDTVVLTFVGQTMALRLAGEEVEETELPALVTDQQTFYCSNVTGNAIIQITTKSVRLMDDKAMELICDWSPPDGRGISTAACNSSQVMVAVGCDLYYLEVKPGSPGELLLISHTTMSHEVACLDINPLSEAGTSSLCAVGLWTDISVQILNVPQFEHLFTQPLGGDIIPRSVLMVELGGACYLLCALGDGCLHYYTMDSETGQLRGGKRVVLGTKPIVLKQFKSDGVTSVFACSDHPTIIHFSNQKLLFSNVNVKEVNYICTLNSEAFQNSLALVDSSTLIFGCVDQIQMLHIETIPLGESPRCIAYQESSQTFLVGGYRTDKSGPDNTYTPSRQSVSTRTSNVSVAVVPPQLNIEEFKCPQVEMHSLILFDQTTFDVSHVYQLCPQEHILCVTSCNLTTNDEERSVYVVGTALVKPEEKESSTGRILVFAVNSGKLELLHEKLENGAVFQVLGFNGKILNSVNSGVFVNALVDGALKEECAYKNNILALYLKTKGDFILVGDILRSLKLLVYKEELGLEEIGVDHNISPCFCTAIEMIDDENYLGADGRHIFICQKNTEATSEADLLYMVQPSRMYFGDNVNVFSRGSFVMDHPGAGASSLLQGKPILFGTVHGAIGLIGTLNMDTYTLLSKLQQKMAANIKSVGNIEHEIYRSFSNEHRSKPFAGFIDGDLVEKFLELPRPQMSQIVQGIKTTDVTGTEVDVSVDDILKLIEDLSRLH
ncbi:PREDICTED: DNA damage-binding protein 1-like [Amphimedon queenslandica]|uniref:DNA damage-binding protein 1 n=1 Tax=Amphimedon queenslandica TaxID=400682 RepID=A0A1X7U124_AMPQE|nr:PREDICTED: DNA damage-binding protein 1-like [Amphimedon queenslandica]|eukprot:XP_003389315.1 PREDICTED: DNA damage-binding protein 1-like [Amphimedon queenslandica]